MRKHIIALIAILFIVSTSGCNTPQNLNPLPSTIESSAQTTEPRPLDEKDVEYSGDGSDLIPAWIRDTGEAVLITADGKVVMQLQGDSIAAFYPLGEGLVSIPGKEIVRLDGEVVFDSSNNYVDSPSQFSEGLSSTCIMKDGFFQSGYIDSTGKFIIEPIYHSAFSFKDGLAAVSIIEEDREKFGFIDKSGKFVLEPIYSMAFDFSDGFAVVAFEENAGEAEYGLINTSGEIVFRGFSDIEPFKDGLAVAAITNDAGSKVYGYIGLDGEYVIEPSYQCAFSFSEGLAAVAEPTESIYDRIFGYIDISGEYILEPMYGTAGEFWGGIAAVTYGDLVDNELHFITVSGIEKFGDVFDIAIPQKTMGAGVFYIRRNNDQFECFIDQNGAHILEEFSPSPVS